MTWGLRSLITWRLNTFERHYGYDMGYARQILQASLGSFKAFFGLFAMSSRRDAIPVAPWFAARYVATRNEDCGPCQQLQIDMALEQGLTPAMIKAITQGDLQRMGDDAALAYQWAQAIITPDVHADADALREQVLARWGERGLVSMAVAMAGARSYPMIKRALGHNRSCQTLRIGDA